MQERHDTKTISKSAVEVVNRGDRRERVGHVREVVDRHCGLVEQTVFGPTPRKYGYKLPKKVRSAALKSALSSKALKMEFSCSTI